MLEKIKKFLNGNKKLWLVCLFALVARVAYVLFFSSFFAKSYLGRPTLFYPGSDFGTSLLAFRNLVAHGTYTVNLNDVLGAFNRMPGYAFFIGIISSIFPEPYNMYVVSALQILIDVIAVVIVYLILSRRFGLTEKNALFGAFIYAAYPIAIIWTPVLFSDSIGAFFSLWILYIYLGKRANNKQWLYLGLLIGFAMLFRPQALLSILVIGIIECWTNRRNIRLLFMNMLFMGAGILLTYGLYPARNLVFQHKLVLFQDLRGSGNCWNDATVNYMQYIYSVQSHWDPAWTSIMKNKAFEIDPAAFVHPGDSVRLMHAIHHAQNTSYAFSCWDGYWTDTRPASNIVYDDSIAADFALLRAHQMQFNAYHFWVVLPMENLKKCFFKSEMSNKKGGGLLTHIVPLIFYYRTFLLLIGLLACGIGLYRRHQVKALSFILLSFVSWYLLISFGTMAQLRNIEMRYLLPVDVLLLVPIVLVFFQTKKR